MPNPNFSRRTLLKTSAAAATVSALSMSAGSYARIKGANERISIGQIGCGDRGTFAHLPGIAKYKDQENIQVTAIADPWKVHRERISAQVKEKFGREPRPFNSYRELLALADVDAVMIASPDHVHTTHLQAAAEAGKDVYCEKPLATNFDKLKAACDAVKKANVVCQIGTQLRSMGSFTGCKKVVESGVLGKISRIEQCRNGTRPYWYGYVKEVKEADVDWKEFLADAPAQPFNPVKYSGWYGYRDFSDGPVPGFGSHYLDLVHYITGATFPTSAVCLGGTHTWIDDNKFTCPDHVQAMWIYPEGFMVHYSSNLGQGAGNSFKLFGDQGLLDMQVWSAPVLSADGGHRNKGVIRGKTTVQDIKRPDHFEDWLQCLRSRKTPNAPIDAGYQHAVAALMAVKAYDTGKRQVYDREKREIREG